MSNNLWIDDNCKHWAIGSTFGSGETTLTTPGTPVILFTSTIKTLAVAIIADKANTAVVHIGGSDLNYSTKKGIQLQAGQGITLDVDHSKKALYIDSGTASQKVSWIYLGGS